MSWFAPGRVLFLAPLLLAAGCGILRAGEPVGATQTTAIDPAPVPELPPWIKDKDAGLVSLSPGFDLRRYSVIRVGAFTVAPEELHDEEDRPVAAEISWTLHRMLMDRLRQKNVVQQVVDGRAASESMGASTGLTLEGRITRLAMGSRTLRLFAGFGAGRTKLQVEMRLSDAATGKVLLAVADRRVASKGFFGGDSRLHLLESADDMTRDQVKFLKRLSEGKGPED